MIFFNNIERPLNLQNYKISKIIPLETGSVRIYKFNGMDCDPILTFNGLSWEPNQIATYENVYSEVDCVAGVPICDDLYNTNTLLGVNCLVECEPNPDWVEITINITNFLESGTDLEFTIYQNEPNYIIWKGSVYSWEFIQTITDNFNSPTELKLKINKKSVKGIELYAGSLGAFEISGLDQLDQLEFLYVYGSDVQYLSKIIGKIPQSIKYLFLNAVEIDSCYTPNLKVLKAMSVVKCESLTDILEQINETAEYILVDPLKEYTDEVGYTYYDWKFNLAGRINLPSTLKHLALYGKALTLDDLKALYNLIVDLPAVEIQFPMFFSTNEESSAYFTNVFEPMLNHKNIVFGEL